MRMPDVVRNTACCVSHDMTGQAMLQGTNVRHGQTSSAPNQVTPSQASHMGGHKKAERHPSEQQTTPQFLRDGASSNLLP